MSANPSYPWTKRGVLLLSNSLEPSGHSPTWN
jgi:hypothetical protein